MAKIKITNRNLWNLTSTNSRGTRYHDTELPGFGVTAYPTGRKSFWIVYGPKRKRRRMTLGQAGPLSVDAARALAKEHLAVVYQGGDPLAQRDARRATPTLSEWFDDYLAEVDRRKKHPRADHRYLGDCRKRWGDRPIDSLSVDDVRRAMAEMSDGHPIRGNRWLASLRACLNAAWRSDLIQYNPASRIRPNRENPPRQRVLSDDELQRVIQAIEQQPNPFVRLAFLLLITTGARCSEVLRAQWVDVDLDGAIWRIPSPKSGHPQVIPLGPETVILLREAPRVLGSPWLIPGSRPQRHRVDLDKPWREIRQAAEVPDAHIHDLRRTFGLAVARTAGLHVASKLLRHSTVTVTEQVYTPLGIDDLRAGLDKMEQARAKVIPLRRMREG